MLTRLKAIPETDLKQIHEASLDLLWIKGIKIHSRTALDFLSDFDGVAVDHSKSLARFKPDLVEKQIGLAPSSFQLFDRSGEKPITIGGEHCHCINGHCAIYQYDAIAGTRHPISLKEIEVYARIANDIDLFHIVGIQGTPYDVKPENAFVASALTTLRNSDKPFHFTPEFAWENKAILEMVSTISGSDTLSLRPSVLVQHTSMSPLCWPAEIIDSLIENARNNIPVVVLSAPYSGVTAPWTLAGQLTLINTEVLSGIVIAQLASGGCPVMWGDSCATFDMSSNLSVLIGSPEASLLRIASAQIANFYNLPCFTTAPDTDSHLPDQQTAWEKFESTFCSFAAGVNVIANAGMFSTAVCVSPEQLILDAEMYSICMRLLKGIRVDKESIVLSSLLGVDHGGNYMLEDSTVQLLQNGEHTHPLISNRQGYNQWSNSGGFSVEKMASLKVREMLETHKPKQLSAEKEKALQDILNKFLQKG
jgi:trimethylamine--corrinoid protein Co-methyltransferase